MIKSASLQALHKKHALCFCKSYHLANVYFSNASKVSANEEVENNSARSTTTKIDDNEKTVSENLEGKPLKESILQTYKNADWKVWWSSGSYGSHPGKCKLTAVAIPDQLSRSASLYLENHEKEMLKIVSSKLNNVLSSRKVFKNRQSLVPKSRKKPKYSKVDSKNIDLVNLPEERYLEEEKIEKRLLAEKRKFEYNWKQIEYDDLNAAAYLLSRSPACYASSLHVMSEIRINVPNFQPFSMLDFGSGTGMCVWAANSLWKDSLKQYFCVDSSKEMNKLAFHLFTGGDYDKVLPGVFLRQSLPISFRNRYDMVISAYSLSELPTEKERLMLLKLLWEKTDRFLIVIENGSFYGYYIMMEARNLLLYGLEGADKKKAKKWSKFDESASVFSPCPHNFDCPKWGESSCTFTQKYLKPAYYSRLFKSNEAIIATEQFSYMVFEKGVSSISPDEKWPRCVDDPQLKRGCATCHICTPMGNLEHIAVRKENYGRDFYFVSKKSVSGDSLPLTSRDCRIKS